MERRISDRRPIWFPLWLASERYTNALAIGQDTSRTGIKVMSSVAPAVGSAVTVSFRLEDPRTGESTIHNATGIVLRVEANQDPLDLWPHCIVVELDQPFAESEQLVRSSAPLELS